MPLETCPVRVSATYGADATPYLTVRHDAPGQHEALVLTTGEAEDALAGIASKLATLGVQRTNALATADRGTRLLVREACMMLRAARLDLAEQLDHLADLGSIEAHAAAQGCREDAHRLADVAVELDR